MATVTKIQYEPRETLTADQIYHLSNTFFDMFDGYESIYRKDPPLFSIEYAFNPPDDSSVQDIVHKIYVPYDPEPMIHEGDMLPILYLVAVYNRSFVMSMPYPFALNQIASLDDCYYDSSSTHHRS